MWLGVADSSSGLSLYHTPSAQGRHSRSFGGTRMYRRWNLQMPMNSHDHLIHFATLTRTEILPQGRIQRYSCGKGKQLPNGVHPRASRMLGPDISVATLIMYLTYLERRDMLISTVVARRGVFGSDQLPAPRLFRFGGEVI